MAPHEYRMAPGVRIICAYPGTGKSELARQNYAFADIDQPDKKYDMDQYIKLVQQALAIPSVTVLLPTWPNLREALRAHGLEYALFYPSRDLKFDYNKRYVNRGTRKDMVDQLWWNWDHTLQSCEDDPTPYRIEMRQSQAYLSDYFL